MRTIRLFASIREQQFSFFPFGGIRIPLGF
jgi:hypothetical protein